MCTVESVRERQVAPGGGGSGLVSRLVFKTSVPG